MSPKKAKFVNGNCKKPGEKVETAKLIYVHPVWYSFIKYCQTLEYGEIDRLKIQDGLPVSAEKALKKTKFC
jgi:hypothetical protein